MFSVVIPVFNVEPFLRDCLDSLASQSFRDWEAICVDDGSTDSSGAILDEYAARDPRFKVIHQTNQGVGAARNAALDVASGDWIAFLDADDTIDPRWLETATALIDQSNDADMVRLDGLVPIPPPSPDSPSPTTTTTPDSPSPPTTTTKSYNSPTTTTTPDSPSPPTTTTKSYNYKSPSSLSSVRSFSGKAARQWALSTYSRNGWSPLSFIRRDFLGASRYLTDVPLKEDVLFFLDLSSRVESVACGRFPGYFYNIHEGSALRNDRDSTAKRIAFLSALRRYGDEMRDVVSRCAVWDLVQWIAERDSPPSRPDKCGPSDRTSPSAAAMLAAWRGLVADGTIDIGRIYPWWRPGIRRWLKTGDFSLMAATRRVRIACGGSPRDPFAASAAPKGRSAAIDCIKGIAAILVICCHVFDARAQAEVGGSLMPALWRICYYSSVPLFAAVCGWLSRPRHLASYHIVKFVRILVPFFIFSTLKILYSVAIDSSYAHADSLGGMVFDAFVLGRLYWFAYAIFLVLAIAPLFWRLNTAWLALAFLVSCGLSHISPMLPEFFQLQGAASLLPAFLAGMLTHRLFASTTSPNSSPVTSIHPFNYNSPTTTPHYNSPTTTTTSHYNFPLQLNSPNPQPPSSKLLAPSSKFSSLPRLRGLAFLGRNAWAIMFLDPFFKAILVKVLPGAATTPAVILLDVAFCAAACRLLSHIPFHNLLGVSR